MTLEDLVMTGDAGLRAANELKATVIELERRLALYRGTLARIELIARFGETEEVPGEVVKELQELHRIATP